MDRTFLLADARPARETIYPAATRHREGLDIYVNRAPLALDIADRRADNDREAVVTDTEIRAYLADRWSRSQPKEAALDYMADGKTGESMSERTIPGQFEKLRENRWKPGRRRTTTRWLASHGISGAPLSAGAMPRRYPTSPMAAKKF